MRWRKQEFLSLKATTYPDHDTVECFVFALLPIIPLRPVHTFDWSGNEYKVVPLRWSAPHVVGAIAQTWAVAAIICGSVGLALTFLVSGTEPIDAAIVASLVALLVAGIACRWLVRRSHARTRDVRLVLGPHDRGTSDPATWQQDPWGAWATDGSSSTTNSSVSGS